MSWHIRVYSRGMEDYVAHYHSFHLFTNTPINPKEAIKRAEGVLPPFALLGLVRVEYEKLPFNVSGCHVAFARGTVISSTVPDGLAQGLQELREKTLTLKYHKSPLDVTRMLGALNSLRERGVECRVYEAGEYYHVYAQLPIPLPLGEIMKMREGLEDDPVRLEVDKMYLAAGLEYLANSLPSEYFEFYNGSLLYNGREVEVSVDSITVNLEPARPVETPPPKEVDMKEKIAEAYKKISLRLWGTILACQVTVDGDTVTIHVPEWQKDFVGRLIGKGGANVRAVEAELGVRIKIVSSSPPPPEAEMRRKLQDLLKRVV
ncbi:MAG: KH domain-containing protein [Thermofilaceae archaeon]